jgi:hypothetical protein
MLCSDVIAVYSENHTKHINMLSGQNAELLNVKINGTSRHHRALKDSCVGALPNYAASWLSDFVSVCSRILKSGSKAVVIHPSPSG